MRSPSLIVLVAAALAAACAQTSAPTPDAGADAGADAGVRRDAGRTTDGGVGDALPDHDGSRPTDDAGSPPADAGALPPCATERVREYVQIPTSDGKWLHASVDRPDHDACPQPVVLIQTPYGIESHHRARFGDDRATQPLFSSPHYTFVMVDWRGTFGSQAAAVAPPQPYAQDGFDVVEWIATQPWSSGRVGTWGVSALCVQQYRTAAAQPPHLFAMVPIFCGMNLDYPQVYPGGVLRREYVDMLDALGFGVREVFEAHPQFDLFWSVIGGAIAPGDIEAPALVVSGWWDLDPRGSSTAYELLARDGPASVRGTHQLLIGPWHHFAAGGESTGSLRALSAMELAYIDHGQRIQQSSLRFFDTHLRGFDAPPRPAIEYRLGNDATWQTTRRWPPSATRRTWFLTAAGGLSPTAPAAATRTHLVDPLDPSPTRGGGTLAPTEMHGPALQDDVVARGDAATFMTATLAQPLRIAGPVRIELELSTDAADTDVAVRLTDVDAAGRHLLIGEGIQRVSLRGQASTPAPVPAGERAAVTVRLTGDVGYVLDPGHRLGLIIAGSNYPRFARNPGNGRDFVGDASPVASTTTLYLDGTASISVPTIE